MKLPRLPANQRCHRGSMRIRRGLVAATMQMNCGASEYWVRRIDAPIDQADLECSVRFGQRGFRLAEKKMFGAQSREAKGEPWYGWGDALFARR